MSLSQIKAPITEELKLFEKYFKNAMKSKVPLLDKIMYYIIQHKGKQVRPIFVFLSAKIFQPITDASYISASLIELLHTGTLVHDDVVDDSNKRRGVFSINALWKNKIAVLVGDFLFMKGFLLALEKKEYLLIEIVAKAVKQMSEGELLQLEKARGLDIHEDLYYEIIRQKTASLIAAACSTGAYSTTKDETIKDLMWDFGEKVGMAYQIKDDLFDYGGFDTGKPQGNDIQEKKMTLPLIHVMSKVSKKDKRWMIKTVKRHNKDHKKVQQLIQFVKDNGGLDYTKNVMLTYKNEALQILDQVPQNENTEALKELVHFVVDRVK